MRRGLVGALAIAALTAAPVQADLPVSLRGSNAAMMRQHSVAVEAGYTFVRTAEQMEEMVTSGELVRLYGNEDYGFRQGVRSLVARPETEIFIERLARDYRAACGEKLIVTSLTRPMSRQPRNAHRLSVHPAGIAVDLRVSQNATCRSWLEDTLMTMEEEGLLDGIRERSPPHYHVALFPDAYMAHVAPMIAAEHSAERVHLMTERMAVLAAGMISVDGFHDRHQLWRLLGVVPLAFLAVLLIGRRATAPAPLSGRLSGRRTTRHL
jgi:hypothetical protein